MCSKVFKLFNFKSSNNVIDFFQLVTKLSHFCINCLTILISTKVIFIFIPVSNFTKSLHLQIIQHHCEVHWDQTGLPMYVTIHVHCTVHTLNTLQFSSTASATETAITLWIFYFFEILKLFDCKSFQKVTLYAWHHLQYVVCNTCRHAHKSLNII